MTGANTKVEIFATKYAMEQELSSTLANKNIFSIQFEGKYWIVVFDNTTTP